jgi:hypothetical protein
MSVGPLGTAGSVAGSQLSQVKGSDTERAQQDQQDQSRRLDSDRHAQDAAGIGETEQDEETSDRDADGRRLWEKQVAHERDPTLEETIDEGPRSKDPTGQRGGNLDLSG